MDGRMVVRWGIARSTHRSSLDQPPDVIEGRRVRIKLDRLIETRTSQSIAFIWLAILHG